MNPNDTDQEIFDRGKAMIGSSDHKPFQFYGRGENWPLKKWVGTGDAAVVYGMLRYIEVDESGNVTMTAEALRDFANYVYREGWRLGHLHKKSDK